jgi:hypothetical protein
MYSTSRLGVLCALVLASVAAGCSDDDDPTAPLPVAASVLEVSGDSQSTVAGTPIANPLVVRVVTAEGTGLSGVEVTWTAVAGTGTLSAAADTTDADGLAQVQYTPVAAGTDTIAARVANVTVPVQFTVMAMAGSGN